ncbi:MAG: hypothetical protein ACRYGO_08510 [Janthinobacterium lividum]
MSTLPNQLVPACRRRNHVMAAYVNAAAVTQARLGLQRIERFASEADVPPHVVSRVLVAGGPRRPCARCHEFAERAGLGDDGAAASSAYFRIPMAAAAPGWGVNRRVNEPAALLVDAAVNAAASHGIAGAAAELIDFGFPVEFVFRVLCDPRARRRYLFPMPPVENRPAPGRILVCRRRNRLQAAYVDAALTISKTVNVRRAEAILVEQGVAQRVIVRVLHLNGLRRSQGSAAQDALPRHALPGSGELLRQAGDSM